MTITEAQRIVNDFFQTTGHTDADEFAFIEAMGFLIDETKDPDHMNNLGAYYYGQKQFDLALKYYEMAAEYGNLYAISNLGYIWYYGRTGEKNYEKAFHYYEKARDMGDLVAAYKIADMYRNGYYVEKDLQKYREIIEGLYQQVEDAEFYEEPLPEVFTRLAKIRSEEGKTEEALSLYDRARDFLAERISENPFFGNLNIMKWMIDDIYKLREFDTSDISLYDLYYLLKKPAKVSFRLFNNSYEAASLMENGECVIRFGGDWYRTVDDFFKKARIDGDLLTMLNDELYDFEVK